MEYSKNTLSFDPQYSENIMRIFLEYFGNISRRFLWRFLEYSKKFLKYSQNILGVRNLREIMKEKYVLISMLIVYADDN